MGTHLARPLRGPAQGHGWDANRLGPRRARPNGSPFHPDRPLWDADLRRAVRPCTGKWRVTGGWHPRKAMTHALHPSVAERLARLAPDQRAAATAPPGPVLCVAPAGSGKTTTAGRADRVAGATAGRTPIDLHRGVQQARGGGADGTAGRRAGAPRRCSRLRAGPDVPRPRPRDPPGRGRGRGAAADRDTVLRELSRLARADRGEAGRRVLAAQAGPPRHSGRVAQDPTPGPLARAYIAYQGAVRGRAASTSTTSWSARSRPCTRIRLLARWRARTAGCCVDEAQDLDRTQLELALLLAAPRTPYSSSATTTSDLLVASGRRAARPRAGRVAARPATGGPRDQLPLPATGRGPRGAPRRAQPERFAKRILAGSRAGGRDHSCPTAPTTTSSVWGGR